MITPHALPTSLLEAWDISAADLIADTHSSLVFRARRGPESVVIKCLKPEGHGERPGMDFLEWREGHGAVQLLQRIGDACMMVDAGTRTLRDYLHIHGDEAASVVVLDVLTRLHAPSAKPRPTTLVPLERHFRSLFELVGTARNPEIGDLAGWAAHEALDLLAHQHGVRPLHGDLHHDNIVGDAAGDWRAIDPQGLHGDPVYDVSNIYGNPLGGRAIILDPQRIIRLTMTFASHFGCAPRKVLRYAAVHAMLSVAWTLDRTVTQSGEENLSERLAFARIAQSLLIEQFVD